MYIPALLASEHFHGRSTSDDSIDDTSNSGATSETARAKIWYRTSLLSVWPWWCFSPQRTRGDQDKAQPTFYKNRFQQKRFRWFLVNPRASEYLYLCWGLIKNLLLEHHFGMQPHQKETMIFHIYNSNNLNSWRFVMSSNSHATREFLRVPSTVP